MGVEFKKGVNHLEFISGLLIGLISGSGIGIFYMCIMQINKDKGSPEYLETLKHDFSIIHKYLKQRLVTETNPYKVKYLEGQLDGIKYASNSIDKELREDDSNNSIHP